jgi:hypothetical protein
MIIYIVREEKETSVSLGSLSEDTSQYSASVSWLFRFYDIRSTSR